MPRSAEEHFKLIMALQVADLAVQLANARAFVETLEADLATRPVAPPPARPTRTPST